MPRLPFFCGKKRRHGNTVVKDKGQQTDPQCVSITQDTSAPDDHPRPRWLAQLSNGWNMVKRRILRRRTPPDGQCSCAATISGNNDVSTQTNSGWPEEDEEDEEQEEEKEEEEEEKDQEEEEQRDTQYSGTNEIQNEEEKEEEERVSISSQDISAPRPRWLPRLSNGWKMVKRRILKEQRNPQYLSLTRADIYPNNDAFKVRYKELKILGEGGCATVFAGYRKKDKLPVAIKHIPKDSVFYTTTRSTTYKFPQEVQLLLRAAGEPGQSAAVALLDWYSLKQEVLLVLERPVLSTDLFQYINKSKVGLLELQAKVFMRQLVEAVIEIHSRGVFHRDLKPENILVETGSDVPRLRLIDFGGAWNLHDGLYRDFLGTYEFNPPEWHRDHTYKAVELTAWQLGMVLYCMFHPDLPFVSSSNAFVYSDPYIKDDLSQKSKDMLRSCLSKESADRPALESMLLHPWLEL